jgi:hypothetical protein
MKLIIIIGCPAISLSLAATLMATDVTVLVAEKNVVDNIINGDSQFDIVEHLRERDPRLTVLPELLAPVQRVGPFPRFMAPRIIARPKPLFRKLPLIGWNNISCYGGTSRRPSGA